jgi:hypothetical protein
MGKTGGATGSISYTPGRLLRIKAERAAEYRRWESLNGPVHVRQLTAEEMKQRKLAARASGRVSSRS